MGSFGPTLPWLTGCKWFLLVTFVIKIRNTLGCLVGAALGGGLPGTVGSKRFVHEQSHLGGFWAAGCLLRLPSLERRRRASRRGKTGKYQAAAPVPAHRRQVERLFGVYLAGYRG